MCPLTKLAILLSISASPSGLENGLSWPFTIRSMQIRSASADTRVTFTCNMHNENNTRVNKNGMYTRMIPAITQSMQSYTRHPALGSRQHVQTQRKEEKHNAKPCKHKGIVMVPYNDSCYIYNSYILLHHRPWLCHFQKQTSISRSPQSLPPVPVKLHAPQLKRSANKTHPHRITSYCYRRSRVFASFINTIVKYQ